MLIAGVAIADSDHHGRVGVYTSMLEVLGALFALISAVFIILTLVSGSKTAPS